MKRPRNYYRAQRAGMGLNTYVLERKEDDSPRYDEEPLHDILTDFLTDLLHYCSLKALPFEACLELAREHFRAEGRGSKRPSRRG